MAAGISKRMKNYDPRPCLPINENTILIDDQISKFRQVYKNPKITVVTGHKSDKIVLNMKSTGITVVHNENFEATNSLGSVFCYLSSKEALQIDNILVSPSDIFFNKQTIQYIANIHYSDGSCIVYDNNEQIHKNKIGALIDKSKLCNMSYYHKKKWTGLVFFNKNEISVLRKSIEKVGYEKKYVFEIINEISSIPGMCFHAHCPPLMKIIEVDSIRDIKSERFANINK